MSMSIAEIANDLVELCRKGKFMEATEKYYSDKIVSVESGGPPGVPLEMKGIEAIREKSKSFMENTEIHSAEVSEPYIGKKKFAVEFKMDMTHKPSGRRMQMDEMALYTVEGGKIVHEHFYYKTGA
jgi:ketosteroid isomerase-like protein